VFFCNCYDGVLFHSYTVFCSASYRSSLFHSLIKAVAAVADVHVRKVDVKKTNLKQKCLEHLEAAVRSKNVYPVRRTWFLKIWQAMLLMILSTGLWKMLARELDEKYVGRQGMQRSDHAARDAA